MKFMYVYMNVYVYCVCACVHGIYKLYMSVKLG